MISSTCFSHKNLPCFTLINLQCAKYHVLYPLTTVTKSKMSITWTQNMSRHGKAKNEGTKGRWGEKIAVILLVLAAFKILGQLFQSSKHFSKLIDTELIGRASSNCSQCLLERVVTHCEKLPYKSKWVIHSSQAHYTLRVKANVQLKSSNPHCCKSWNQPHWLYTRSCSAEIGKHLFNMPQVTNKCWTLWPRIDPNAKRRIASNLVSQFATPWGQCSSLY